MERRITRKKRDKIVLKNTRKLGSKLSVGGGNPFDMGKALIDNKNILYPVIGTAAAGTGYYLYNVLKNNKKYFNNHNFFYNQPMIGDDQTTISKIL
jgi:hypothetical protein